MSSQSSAISSLAFASGAIATAASFGCHQRKKIASQTKNILPPTTVHPLMIHPDQLVLDDDVSSIYSDTTSICTVDRKTSSVPNLPGILNHAWDSSASFNPTSYAEPKKCRSSLPLTTNLSSNNLTSSNKKLRHNRSLSLPPPIISDLPQSIYKRQPTASECWDDEFELDNDLIVPTSVEEAQFSLRTDISNILDFIEHVNQLLDQKHSLSMDIKSKMNRKWKYGFAKSKSKKLEKLFRADWEEAAVIIDLSDVAQDRQPNFGDTSNVEVDIERIPSERHMQVLEKIIVEELGHDDSIFTENRYNHCNHGLNHSHNAKKQKLMNGKLTNNVVCCNVGGMNMKKKRKENFRINVEVMPKLIEHLKILQKRLLKHINELKKHRLYPQRIANYYIRRGSDIETEGQKQIHLLAKGGQLTLAIHGTGYSPVVKGVPRSIANDDQYVTLYFEEIQKKIAKLRHLEKLEFNRMSAEKEDTKIIRDSVGTLDVAYQIREKCDLSFNQDDIEFQYDNDKITRAGDYICNFCFRDIDMKIPVKISIKSIARKRLP
ncbi:9123_t:CDS:2 [Diversispora eburnea]|uniref:9123_t:CDS:1 n=1 Tax=Diversispora eburnea TaxID=1213867 RepID=A0A9N8VNG1_9GLOM|nr:9123_t:CDS:2 [Diversispora eburnea]